MSLEVARQEFDVAKTRYVHSVIATEIGTRYADLMRKRDLLRETLERAQALYRDEDEARTSAIRAYALRIPHRVNELGVHKPTIFDRFSGFRNVHQFYDRILSAAARRRFARDAINESKAELDEFERMLEAVFAAREKVVRRRLGTPSGLRKALQTDPLLAMSHAQLVAATNASDIAS